RLAGEALDGFGEAEAVRTHHEADGVAVRPAAEAVVEALLVADGEGRRLLVVEGAEAGMFAAPADQPHLAADGPDQGYPFAQLFQETRREAHAKSRLLIGLAEIGRKADRPPRRRVAPVRTACLYQLPARHGTGL